MIIYIESNFVLELAFLQEDYRSCRTFLDFSRNHQIQLVIPAFCIGEPYEAISRKSKHRRQLHSALMTEITEMSRSKPYRHFSHDSIYVTRSLINSIEEEKNRLDRTLREILACADVIPIDRDTIRRAIRSQNRKGLIPQDSIVYASVLGHARSHAKDGKCFLNKNSRDFLNPDIVNELLQYNCRLITKFSDGLDYVNNLLSH